MSAVGARIAAQARSLIGTGFRLQGRDPASGLDCVGLVLACLQAAGRPLAFPASYGLRTLDPAPLIALSKDTAAADAAGPLQPGDILLVRPGAAQHHLLVALDALSFVHAHASLRRVVETPFPSPWPILRHWRLT